MKKVEIKIEKMYDLLNLIETPKYKLKNTGSIKTPIELVDEMIDQIPEKVWEKGGKFLDPCCGRGIFLLRIIDKLLKHHTKERIKYMIYGVDIDPYMVQCTRKLIGKKLGIDPTKLINIQEANFLKWEPKKLEILRLLALLKKILAKMILPVLGQSTTLT